MFKLVNIKHGKFTFFRLVLKLKNSLAKNWVNRVVLGFGFKQIDTPGRRVKSGYM